MGRYALNEGRMLRALWDENRVDCKFELSAYMLYHRVHVGAVKIRLWRLFGLTDRQ